MTTALMSYAIGSLFAAYVTRGAWDWGRAYAVLAWPFYLPLFFIAFVGLVIL